MIAGDLCDAKDFHGAEFTNRVVRELTGLLQFSPLREIVILMGNHDYLRKGHAFFAFLSHIPGIRFVTSTFETMDDGPLALFCAHTKSPEAEFGKMDLSHYAYMFIHQTVTGSIADNGMEMTSGSDLSKLRGPKIYSGDIHVPQKVGNVEYIGSPYHVHFGDKFEPRCVLIDSRNRAHDLHFDAAPRRLMLRVGSIAELKQSKVKPHDHVKVRLTIDPADAHLWAKLRRQAEDWLDSTGVKSFGVEMELSRRQRIAGRRLVRVQAPGVLNATDAVVAYAQAEGLTGEAVDLGLDLLP